MGLQAVNDYFSSVAIWVGKGEESLLLKRANVSCGCTFGDQATEQ